MADKILVIGDTHVSNFQDLPKMMLMLIKDADWVIHVGDYISKDVVSGLMKTKGPRFQGVYGNADPMNVREKLLAKKIMEISKKKIGITHPATGGSYENTRKKVINEFKNCEVDIIVYGHTHDALIEDFNGILLINPGKGYLEKNYYGPPTTVAILFIEKKIRGEIKIIQV